jgi:hypothetical protein
MFTQNYIDFQKARFTATTYSGTQRLVAQDGAKRNAQVYTFWIADIGSWMHKGRCGTFSDHTVAIASDSQSGVYFGSGSTPASKADYNLEEPITSGLSITNPTSLIWAKNGDGNYSACADFIIRNTRQVEISISEIGVFTPVTTTSNIAPSSNVQVYNVLMERTVLDAPIVIPVGEAKVITYKITFNQSVA